MNEEQIPQIGPCYACGRAFRVDAGEVVMFTVDPETGLPPGLSVLGTRREPSPEAVARAVEKPVCPDCVARAERFTAESDTPPSWPTWP
ncbi:hypothetical protein DP939_26580 [Spongiactinospora rosea]|uniref:Uncharacterized protein n=1 Tax=Spongiactinospora rosea TaxID=2248750 RepID=A0A366LTH6_9ACTN|nr:hypothetical protein [Spongiactinospora rosea]RBQ17057.1 hypothetical protein DP939_26580 [Spongiactinospora rosea]